MTADAEFRILRGGETYAEFCARAAAANCPAMPLRNWAATAAVVDGVWRTRKSERVFSAEDREDCPACDGRGEVWGGDDTYLCSRCDGYGVLNARELGWLS